MPWTCEGNKKLELFLSCPADEILYGGSAGSAKSEGLMISAIGNGDVNIFTNPNWKVLYLRRTFPELESSAILRSQQLFHDKGKYDAVKHRWTFGAGGMLQFGHIKNEDELFKHQSTEWTTILFDELTTFTERMYLYLFSRLRSRDEKIRGRIRAGTNPGNLGHCLDHGDVLTLGGWKPIRDVKVGESVATLGKDGDLIYVKVGQTHSSDFDGELVQYGGNSTHISCTPNHSIAVRTETKSKSGRTFHKPSLRTFSELADVTRLVRSAERYAGDEIGEFRVPVVDQRKSKLSQPMTLSGDDYCELMGWMMSEGYTVERDGSFGIAQMKPVGREKIEALLQKCGFSYRKYDKSFVVSSRSWQVYFRGFGKCRDKFVPFIIKNSCRRQMELFWEAAMAGDGHDKTYYTTSRQMADDMQEIGLKLGYSPLLRFRQRKNRRGLSYEIVFRLGRDGWLEKRKFSFKRYTGKVYCLGIPKLHRFFVRQDGYIWLSGNSWVKKRFIENRKPYEIYHDRMKLPNGVISDWSQCFIPATVFDNKFLMKSDPLYVRRLMELPETEKQALLYGNWDIFSGQFFPEFCEDHIVDDFDIPKEWPIWLSMDWGYLTKCAVLMWTRDPDTGVIYCFKEIYVSKVPPSGVSDMIKSALGDLFRNIQGRYTDTRVAVKDETNISTQEKFGHEGLYFQIVNDDRVNGWHRLRELLLKDKEGNCRVQIFRSCANLIRTMSQMVHDPNRPEDLNKKSEAHCVDAARYFAVTRHPEGREKISAPVDFSPTTGYIGGRGDSTLLRNRIPRLVGADKSKIVFLDRPTREQ